MLHRFQPSLKAPFLNTISMLLIVLDEVRTIHMLAHQALIASM